MRRWIVEFEGEAKNNMGCPGYMAAPPSLCRLKFGHSKQTACSGLGAPGCPARPAPAQEERKRPVEGELTDSVKYVIASAEKLGLKWCGPDQCPCPTCRFLDNLETLKAALSRPTPAQEAAAHDRAKSVMAQKAVKKQYPAAIAVSTLDCNGQEYFRIWPNSDPKNNIYLGWGDTEEEAWEDAAKKVFPQDAVVALQLLKDVVLKYLSIKFPTHPDEMNVMLTELMGALAGVEAALRQKEVDSGV